MHFHTKRSERDGKNRPEPVKIGIGHGFWVIVGFLLWFGFFLGAVIMHAMDK